MQTLDRIASKILCNLRSENEPETGPCKPTFLSIARVEITLAKVMHWLVAGTVACKHPRRMRQLREMHMNPLPVVHPTVSAGDGSLLLNGLPKISRMFSNSNWAEKSSIDASPCAFIHLKPVVQAHEDLDCNGTIVYFFSVQRLHGFRQVVQHVQLHVAN